MSAAEEIKKRELQEKAGRPFEKCLLCGCETGVPIDQEIDSRAFYIEGAGQLCRDCHKKIYG